MSAQRKAAVLTIIGLVWIYTSGCNNGGTLAFSFFKIPKNLFQRYRSGGGRFFSGRTTHPKSQNSTNTRITMSEESTISGSNVFLNRGNSSSDDVFCEVMDEYGKPAFEAFCEAENGQDERLIRVERSSCVQLENTSKEDILRRIEEAKAVFSDLGLGKSDLYPRFWENADKKQPGTSENDENVISILQFNTLAEGLSAGPDKEPPFGAKNVHENEKSVYGGFSAIPTPEVLLDFAVRRWRILEAILSPDLTNLPDIIAMEEVDRYRGFFAPALSCFGYSGVFASKPHSPGVKAGWYSDGCCLFWKETKFKLVSERKNEYRVGSQVAMIITLRHVSSGQLIVVAVTHLKAQKNATNEKIRCRQVEELIDEIGRSTTDARSAIPVAVLIAGDFNADPPSQIAGDESAVAKILDLAGTREEPTRYKSAYDVLPPGEKLYTTWKIRGSTSSRRIIDYIFYSNRLELVSTLNIPDEDDLEETKLPGLRWPSDHLSIGARFRLKN